MADADAGQPTQIPTSPALTPAGGPDASVVPAALITPLSARQLSQLIPLIPVLIHSVRGSALVVEAGKLLVRSDVGPEDENELLHHVLDLLNLYGDLSLSQIRDLSEEYDKATIAGAVRRVLVESDPPLLPSETREILYKYAELEPGTENFYTVWGGALDKLLRNNYYALAEFFAVLKDVQSSSSVVGPSLMRPATAGESELAPKIVETLILECECLFGRAAGKTQINPSPTTVVHDLGMRPQHEKLAPGWKSGSLTTILAIGRAGSFTPATTAGRSSDLQPILETSKSPDAQIAALGLMQNALPRAARQSRAQRRVSEYASSSAEDALLSARKTALRAFYQWRDDSKVGSVDELFQHHAFVDIARGIFERFTMLPPGWRVELDELLKRDPVGLEWYARSLGKAVKENESKEEILPALPANPPTVNVINTVIDEIIDTEIVFHETISSFLKLYVGQLREIASGDKGLPAASALKLSPSDVENIFGWRLAQIAQTSNFLLGKLDVVAVCRGESRKRGGRALYVAQTFAGIASELSLNFAPYISSHRHSLQLLQKATALADLHDAPKVGLEDRANRVRSVRATVMSIRKMVRGPSRETMGGLNGVSSEDFMLESPAHPSFKRIWESVSNQHARLRGQTLESVLIMPIQRIPRYRLLLVELDKRLAADHPGKPPLQSALTQISTVAQEINEILKRHQKLEALIGQGEMPEIAGASSSMRTGAARIQMSYKAR